MKSDKFIFRKNIDIGSLMAENDELLEEAFVEKPELQLLRNVNNPKAVIIGRTGTGKSALIKHIQENEQNVQRINPEALSLKFLSNSTILNYLRNLGVNLDLFYKLLWKHIFIVEFLKLHFNDIGIKNQNWLNNIFEKYFGDKSKKRAIEYLRKWEDSFWEETEYHIKEIESKLTETIAKELGMDVKSFTSKIQKIDEISELVKGEFKNKAEKVVNEIQVQEIYTILEIMKNDLFAKTSKKHYIIIDDLDKEWVDKNILFELIKNLIVVVSEVNNINNCKVIIAMRENLFEIVLNSFVSKNIQREKYEYINVFLSWSYDEMKELINKRLSILMKGKYTKEIPTVDNILPTTQKYGQSGFEYMLTRTFFRPRDLISFFNKIIEVADGRTEITRAMISLAEKNYSVSRLRAVEDEWEQNYGSLKIIYGFLRNRPESFKMSDVTEDDLTDFILNDDSRNMTEYTDSIRNQYFKDNDFYGLLRKILVILYKTGILGIKLNHSDKTVFSFHTNEIIFPSDLNENSKFFIHKTFDFVFSVKFDKERSNPI